MNRLTLFFAESGLDFIFTDRLPERQIHQPGSEFCVGCGIWYNYRRFFAKTREGRTDEATCIIEVQCRCGDGRDGFWSAGVRRAGFGEGRLDAADESSGEFVCRGGKGSPEGAGARRFDFNGLYAVFEAAAYGRRRRAAPQMQLRRDAVLSARTRRHEGLGRNEQVGCHNRQCRNLGYLLHEGQRHRLRPLLGSGKEQGARKTRADSARHGDPKARLPRAHSDSRIHGQPAQDSNLSQIHRRDGHLPAHYACRRLSGRRPLRTLPRLQRSRPGRLRRAGG